jgi:hypothetical protein
MTTPSTVLIMFDYPPLNKSLIKKLKDLYYKDVSKVLYSNIPYKFPYFILDTEKKEVSVLPPGRSFFDRIYKTSCDYTDIIRTLEFKTTEEQILDTPYSC